MKTEQEIKEKIELLNTYLNDALGENLSGFDPNSLQDAISELEWCLS